MSRGRRQLQPTSFFIRRAIDSILATPVISSVTITSIAVSVLLAGTVLLVGSNVYRVVAGAAASGVDVSVYLANGVSEARVVELKKSFAATEGVGRVQYVSKDEAWQFLAANLVGSAELLDGLDAEVLPASFELALEQGISGPGLDSLLESWSAMPEIEDVQYNRQLSQRLRGTMGLVRWVAWALGALALVASTIIVGATFQLAVFTRREEMEVLRLVGAVGTAYWGPLLLAGLLEGLLGSAAAVAMLALVFRLTAGPLAAELPLLAGVTAFLTPLQSVTLVAWGAGLGVVGSWLGMQRFAAWSSASQR